MPRREFTGKSDPAWINARGKLDAYQQKRYEQGVGSYKKRGFSQYWHPARAGVIREQLVGGGINLGGRIQGSKTRNKLSLSAPEVKQIAKGLAQKYAASYGLNYNELVRDMSNYRLMTRPTRSGAQPQKIIASDVGVSQSFVRAVKLAGMNMEISLIKAGVARFLARAARAKQAGKAIPKTITGNDLHIADIKSAMRLSNEHSKDWKKGMIMGYSDFGNTLQKTKTWKKQMGEKRLRKRPWSTYRGKGRGSAAGGRLEEEYAEMEMEE